MSLHVCHSAILIACNGVQIQFANHCRKGTSVLMACAKSQRVHSSGRLLCHSPADAISWRSPLMSFMSVLAFSLCPRVRVDQWPVGHKTDSKWHWWAVLYFVRSDCTRPETRDSSMWSGVSLGTGCFSFYCFTSPGPHLSAWGLANWSGSHLSVTCSVP